MTEENQNLGSIEERAKRMGWVPKEQFRGNPENHVDPETYVRRAEESLPYLKGTMNNLEKKLAAMEVQDRSMKETMDAQAARIADLQKDMSEFVEFSKGSEKRAYEKALKDLKATQRKARTDGDLEAFAEATDKIDELLSDHPLVTGQDKPLKAPDKQETVIQPTGPEAQFQAWMASDPNAFTNWAEGQKWYSEDPKMAAYADSMDRWLINNKHVREGFKMSRQDHLAEVTKLVKKEFPDYFGNTARKAGSPVEGADVGSPGSNGKHNYHDLPPEAKTICDKWTGKDGKGTSGTIPGLTREQYVKDYFA